MQQEEYKEDPPSTPFKPGYELVRPHDAPFSQKYLLQLLEESLLPDPEILEQIDLEIELEDEDLAVNDVPEIEEELQTYSGFAVNDDQAHITLGFPLDDPGVEISANKPNTRGNSGPKLLAYQFLSDPKPDDGKRVPKVPEVQTIGSKWDAREPEGYSDYEYLLFTYKMIKDPADTDDAPQKDFIFSGGDNTTTSPVVTKNTFIPLNELVTRIGIDADGAARLQAYALDWLTFLAQASPLEMEAFVKLGWASVTTGSEWKKVKGRFDGSHLVTSDTAGNVVDEHGESKGSKRFLRILLRGPLTEHDDISSLQRFIFVRWSKVAYVAAINAKQPWSVKARFWRIPKMPGKAMDFVYIVADLTRMVTDLGDTDQLPQPLRDALQSLGLDRLTELWRVAISQAHEVARAEVNKREDKEVIGGCIVKTNGELEDYMGPDFYFLGRHPQQFFATYLCEEEAAFVKNKGYEEDSRPFPGRDQQLVGKLTNKNLPNVTEMTTNTRITKKGIRNAGIWPRCKSQSAVMSGYSASDIAQDFWTNVEPRSAEWLHRSAYSYGGLIDGNPDSSQIPQNLVFGTYECNTEMIRYESYLKRVADDAEYKVLLKTELEMAGGWGTNSLPWLVPTLKYNWTFFWGDLAVAGSRRFELFSRRHAALFEVEMDEAFDDLWFKREQVKKLVYLFLYLQGRTAV